MDATEQSVGPNKQIRIKTTKKNGRGTFNISNRSENFDKYAGLLNPPQRAMSLFNNQYYRQNQQPPLLPLPNVSTINHQHHHPQLSRSLKKTKDMSLTPKKSRTTKREEAAKKRSATQSISEFLIVASDNRWGPDPKDLPKHLLPVVLTSKVFSGSVLSPPPSSLPLPKFFLRSKLSCNSEAAAGVDAGATNNLRRLLRLR